MLKDEGCDVWLDTSKTLIHLKALLFDGRLLVAGSHNLTAASFLRSEELSVVTDDPGAIRVMKGALKRVVKQRDEIRDGAAKGFLSFPPALLRSVIAPLYAHHSGKAFDLYMMLCAQDGGSPRPVAIEVEKWGRALGFEPEAGGNQCTESGLRYYFQQRVNRILRQLSDRGIVTVDRRKDVVTRRPIPGGGGTIEVPETFWRFGWLSRLSFPAKYFYFISLAETADSPFHPWWSLPARGIARKYGCDPSVRRGALELEARGILEILRSAPRKDGARYSQEAQYYRLNPFRPFRPAGSLQPAR